MAIVQGTRLYATELTWKGQKEVEGERMGVWNKNSTVPTQKSW